MAAPARPGRGRARVHSFRGRLDPAEGPAAERRHRGLCGLGGPFAGTLASLACYFAARDTGSDLLLALSYAGFFINLFNLIPLSLFDGGRITAVLSPRVWLAGVPVLVALFFWRPSPMLILVAVLAFPNVVRAFKYDPTLPENQAYYGTTLETSSPMAAPTWRWWGCWRSWRTTCTKCSRDCASVLSRRYVRMTKFIHRRQG